MPVTTVIKSAIVILLLWIVGLLTVSVAYGAFLVIRLVIIVIASGLFVLLPLTLILNKLIKVKQPLIHLLIAVGLLGIFTSSKQSIIAEVACRSAGGITVDELINGKDSSEKPVTFCGYLQRCIFVSLELEPVQYEICSISDIWNDSHRIQYYTTNLSTSDDPLVQVSRDAQLLSGLPKDTIIIDTGFLRKSVIDKCWFDEVCGSGSQSIVNVFRDNYVYQLVNEPSK